LKVFGSDYATRDGTCVRDYVHVNDLASAHLKAVEFMRDHEGAHIFNLGNGEGFSVREVIAAAERVTGQEVSYDMVARRPGDPPTLVASGQRARELLGWQPEFTDLDDILASAWDWHTKPAF
jgi:UDP-glucose 4-epimerase